MERTDPVLLLPGPTPVPEEVRSACARQVVFHRGDDFAGVHAEVLERLRAMFRTEGRVAVLPCSGTGALEAALVNTLSPGDRVLACPMGEFGYRFAAAAETYGLAVDRLEVPWGAVAEPGAIVERVRRGRYRAVLLTHCETSTGVLLPLREVAAAIREADPAALILVDAVSSFAAVPLHMDSWGIDVAVTGSQKALMTPPGLGIVAVGPRGLEAVRTAGLPRFTWDLRPYLQEPPDLPYTAAVTLWFGLQAALRRIAREGEENVHRRHRLLSRMVRAGARAVGMEPVAADAVASPTVTALTLPPGREPAWLIRELKERGVAVAGGLGPLRGRVVRMGHMGAVQPEDVLVAMAALDDALGAAPASGARAAAERVRAEAGET